MKPLDKTFTYDGFTFRQLQRSETHAIYEKVKHDRISDYEVIFIRKQKAGSAKFGDRTVELEAKEIYPTSQEWGINGWTYLDLEQAKKKFYALT